LNRLMLAEHDSAGLHQRATLVVQETDPDTEADQAALYAKQSGGLAELFFRGADGGAVTQLTKDGAASGNRAAALTGCLPAWSSANVITLTSGEVDIRGSLYQIPATLTKSGQSGFTAFTWLYLKVYAPASGSELDATAMALDPTAPQWSDAYKAWYIGTERVIAVLRSDGSGGVDKFYGDGRHLWLGSPIMFLSTSSPATGDTALSVGLPPLGSLLFHQSLYLSLSNAQAYQIYMTPHGTSPSGQQHLIYEAYAPASYARRLAMFSGDNQQVNYKTVWNGSGTMALWLHGLALPEGMAR
ncbi:MAG: hypothetical protein K9K36_04815, partial [Desulfarculaceae bacterium]|nr:hypothetical protein [Desulfarculaceae bacterium]